MLFRSLNYLIAPLVLTANLGLAETIETKKMQEILPFVDSATLVVFDLDNTIMEPPQMLGSDQWFGYLEKSLVAQGHSAEQATDKAVEIWMAAQRATDMKPVEKLTPSLVRLLQHKRGVKVLALTARPFDLRDRTREELVNIGVDFSVLSSWIDPDRLPSNVTYEQGIISIGPKVSKGATLKQFLEVYGSKFKRVVFVDDKVKHVTTVEQSLKGSRYEVFTFRYGAADETVAQFSSQVADMEYAEFQRTGKIISDSEARYLLQEPGEAH